jgi:ABC-type antimicrobial peptide transport system ATPase subunit
MASRQLSVGKRASLYNAALAAVAETDMALAVGILDTMGLQGVRPDVVSYCVCASAAQLHGNMALAHALLLQVSCAVRRRAVAAPRMACSSS